MKNTDEQFKQINDSIGGLQKTLKSHEEKIKKQDEIIQVQCIQINENSEKIKNLEISLRKKNLLFHKVPETESSEQNLKDIISSYCTNDLNINVSPTDIEYLYRLGKKEENIGSQEKMRPVLVAFFSYATKLSVMKQRSRSKTYGISEDFPKEVVDARRKLIPVLERFRSEGKKVLLEVDKLLVDGKVWEDDRENDETSNKRKGDCISPTGNETKKPSQGTPQESITPQDVSNVPAPNKPESRRSYLKYNQRTPTCSPITKFLSKKAVEDITTLAKQNGSDDLLNQTLK